MKSIILILVFAICSVVSAAATEEVRKFLHDYRHSWCPYALPAETSIEEIEKVADLGFDTVGLSFVGPYNGGNMDFTKLDEAIAAVDKRGARSVLHLAPRFFETEGVHDRMSNGRIITAIWNKNPEYSIVDVFDPAQRAKFDDWIARCAKRYGADKRVAGFVIGWGYQGETGFYNGDWNTRSDYVGSECAGYSDHALTEFNKWRAKSRLPALDELPKSSLTEQSRDYVLFHRFRCEFLRDVFQKGYIDAAKAHTKYPVGTFGYISVGSDSYSRNWVDAPNADFLRTAGSASSFDMSRSLIDSGIGWEDAALHDGHWNFTAACMMRDEARQIARGGVFHAMYVRVYETEPQWEKDVFGKVASFLKTQDLEKKVVRSKPTVALYQPTWGTAAIPGRSEAQPYVPRGEYTMHIARMIGLTESFGLRYEIVTEWDLLDPTRLREYDHIIVPLWDMMPKVLGQVRCRALARDKRVIGIPLRPEPLTRAELRELLSQAGAQMYLDFESERIIAGRTHNLIYNWDDKPIAVRIPERKDPIDLKPYEYIFIGPF